VAHCKEHRSSYGSLNYKMRSRNTTPPVQPAAPPKGRTRKPSAKVLEIQQSLRTRTIAPRSTQNEPTASATPAAGGDYLLPNHDHLQPLAICALLGYPVKDRTVENTQYVVLVHFAVLRPQQVTPDHPSIQNDRPNVTHMFNRMLSTLTSSCSSIFVLRQRTTIDCDIVIRRSEEGQCARWSFGVLLSLFKRIRNVKCSLVGKSNTMLVSTSITPSHLVDSDARVWYPIAIRSGTGLFNLLIDARQC
jgi:hypothetical protein